MPSKPEKPRSLLDSYAILALLNDEPGAQVVADLLRAGVRDEAPEPRTRRSRPGSPLIRPLPAGTVGHASAV